MLCLALSAVLCPTHAAVFAYSPVVSSIKPNCGSIQGGTMITITGAQFARNGIDGQTLVYIGVQLCTVNLYMSTDTMVR